ncbi:MAG: hypothetical protein KAS71_07100, partial [Bacteroidales bacterium]|nr:hypothetical protein [Bacteroidales bacterium]
MQLRTIDMKAINRSVLGMLALPIFFTPANALHVEVMNKPGISLSMKEDFSLVDDNAKSTLDKPNVILIYADDLGRGLLGYEGQQIIKTPNI